MMRNPKNLFLAASFVVAVVVGGTAGASEVTEGAPEAAYTHPYKVCEQMTNETKEYAECLELAARSLCENFDRVIIKRSGLEIAYICYGAEERALPETVTSPVPPSSVAISDGLSWLGVSIVLLILLFVSAVIVPVFRPNKAYDHAATGKEPTLP